MLFFNVSRWGDSGWTSELWLSDGTEIGTERVLADSPVRFSPRYDPGEEEGWRNPAAVYFQREEMLLFSGDDGETGAEPWALPLSLSSPRFRRGDCNDDGSLDISDAVFTLGSLFLGEGDPGCDDACDSNDDGAVDISDAINTLGVLFLGNGVIPLPGMTECGVDPTDDGVECETFQRCP